MMGQLIRCVLSIPQKLRDRLYDWMLDFDLGSSEIWNFDDIERTQPIPMIPRQGE